MQESHAAAALLLRRLCLPAALALAGAALALAPPAGAAGPAPAEPPGYGRDVGPLFGRWCVSCHGPDEAEGGLRLDSFAAVMRGGDAGPAVIARDPEASLLVAKVERRHRPAMPPRRKLPAGVVALIRAWIAAGAPP